MLTMLTTSSRSYLDIFTPKCFYPIKVLVSFSQSKHSLRQPLCTMNGRINDDEEHALQDSNTEY